MAKEFKPRSWQAEVPDLVKEYEAWDRNENGPAEIQTEPEEFSKGMVRRGTLDPNTGLGTGNSKQGTILNHNVRGFSERGKRNYEAIFGHP